MRSLFVFATAALMLAATGQAMLKSSNGHPSKIAGRDERLSSSCEVSPGTAAFGKFLKASSEKNVAAIEPLLADDFVYKMPINTRMLHLNKTAYLDHVTKLYAGEGTSFLRLGARFASDNAGAARVRFTGFKNTSQTSPIEDYDLLWLYQTDESYTKIQFLLEFIHPFWRKYNTHQQNVTLGAWANVKGAYLTKNITQFRGAFAANASIFQLQCGADSVSPVTRQDLVTKTQTDFGSQVASRIKEHSTYLNSEFGAIRSTAYTTYSDNRTKFGQVLVEHLTVYSVNGEGAIDTWYSFQKVGGTNLTQPGSATAPCDGKSSTKGEVLVVVGAVLVAIAFLIAAALVFFEWKKRTHVYKRSVHADQTMI